MPRPPAGLLPRRGRVLLRVERLEDRAVASATLANEVGPFFPTVMAGDPRGSPSDSAAARIDENTAASPFAGVGSLQVLSKSGTFLGTATAIGPRYILTAAHVVDINGDGLVDGKDGLKGVYFILNSGKDQSSKIAVSKFDLHPDFTGFNRPSVHDDLAVLTLAQDLPEGLPIYPLPDYDLMVGNHITIVGYGRSGTGNWGYTTGASLTVKRVGENVVDGFYGQDDEGRPFANEMFRFDFDGPKGNGPLGLGTVGNNRETTLGPGDSGGPSFVYAMGQYVLAGVNTFVQGANAALFGSMAGGVDVYAYIGFIRSIIDPEPADGDLAPRGEDLGLPLLPVIGPGTMVPVAPGAAGIKVGAKPVSGFLAGDGLGGLAAGSGYNAGRPTWTSDDRRSDRDSDDSATTDPGSAVSFIKAPAFEVELPLGSGGLISMDAGLLALATGDQLSLDN